LDQHIISLVLRVRNDWPVKRDYDADSIRLWGYCYNCFVRNDWPVKRDYDPAVELFIIKDFNDYIVRNDWPVKRDYDLAVFQPVCPVHSLHVRNDWPVKRDYDF